VSRVRDTAHETSKVTQERVAVEAQQRDVLKAIFLASGEWNDKAGHSTDGLTWDQCEVACGLTAKHSGRMTELKQGGCVVELDFKRPTRAELANAKEAGRKPRDVARVLGITWRGVQVLRGEAVVVIDRQPAHTADDLLEARKDGYRAGYEDASRGRARRWR
jgi:hypothetical protein